MKWLFLLFLAVLVPALVEVLRRSPQHQPKLWLLIGFLPFVQAPWHLYVAPVSWATWPGYVKGAEISLLDALALVVVILGRGARPRLPLKYFFLGYIFAAFLSVFQSNLPTASLFYVWQLARMFLLFTAIVRICDDRAGAQTILFGMVLGLSLQAGLAVQEKLGGKLQAGGSFGHQNLLGMISHFVVFPSIAILMGGARGLALKTAPVAGLIIAIVGASRATIGLAAVGYAAVLAASCFRKWTPRKARVVILVVLSIVAAAPFALSSLERRYSELSQVGGEYDERAAFETAALLMVAEHPMGVGANHYILAANAGGYSERAGVIWVRRSRAANVHNTYLLIAAETGYLGLLAFVLLLGAAIILALRSGWKARLDARGDLLLGLGITLVVVSLHCFYEWVFVSFHVQYLFAINLGLIAGTVIQLRSKEGSVRRRSTRSSVFHTAHVKMPMKSNVIADPSSAAPSRDPPG